MSAPRATPHPSRSKYLLRLRQVNVDDELYMEESQKHMRNKSETSAELDLDEFVEIVIRIANEKV